MEDLEFQQFTTENPWFLYHFSSFFMLFQHFHYNFQHSYYAFSAPKIHVLSYQHLFFFKYLFSNIVNVKKLLKFYEI